jgi:hypothetical protein
MKRRHILGLLLACPIAIAAPHNWCGSPEPGKGLLFVSEAGTDRMCGFIEAKYTGLHNFTAASGTRLMLGRQLVTGPVQLKQGDFYAVVIETPTNPDFVLKWDQPLGVPLDIPPTVLYQPTRTVKAGCEAIP